MKQQKMIQISLKMPRLGETMEQGTIIDWLIDVGEGFKRGDAILEVETDKTVVEFPALGDGILTKTLVQPGEIVDVGTPIAMIDVKNAQDWDDGGVQSQPDDHEQSATTRSRETSAQSTQAPAPTTSATHDENAPIRATPPARLFARQSNIPLEKITGTGRRGRIELLDVMAAQTEGPKTFLLIHGFAGDASTWVQLEATLKRQGHKVYTPDLPAHGSNSSQASTPDQLNKSIKTLALTLPQPLHIVGHSLGAWVAAGIAAEPKINVASLTLIAPMGVGHSISGDFIHGMANVQTLDTLKQLLRQLSPKSDTLSSEAIDKMLISLSRGQLSALAQSLVDTNGQTIDIHSPLANVPRNTPITAIIGTKDQIIPPIHALNMPARISVHFVKTGHMPHWDEPSEIAKLIMANSSKKTGTPGPVF